MEWHQKIIFALKLDVHAHTNLCLVLHEWNYEHGHLVLVLTSVDFVNKLDVHGYDFQFLVVKSRCPCSHQPMFSVSVNGTYIYYLYHIENQFGLLRIACMLAFFCQNTLCILWS